MDLRQSPEYAAYMRAIGWKVQRFRGIFIYLKRLPILGLKLAKIQRYSSNLPLPALRQFLLRHKVVYTILEPVKPQLNLADYRFTPSSSPYLPTKTLVLDLTIPETKLFQNFSTNLKRILNQTSPTQMVIPTPNKFHAQWRRHAKVWAIRENNFDALLGSFGNNAQLFASSFQNQLISGVIILQTPTGAYYYQAWTSPAGRKLNAHHHLMWHVLQKLKKQKVSQFDWDGIEDSRFPRKSWAGFSTFKRKFGGQEVEYPGCFQRWF